MTTETAGKAPAWSLARGAAGVALLRIEQAMTGAGTWADVRAVLTEAAAEPVDAGPAAALYAGAPALAFVLHVARADGQTRYQAAASELDGLVLRTARKRLASARQRHSTGHVSFRDFDAFYGLAGIAALLIRTSPGSEVLGGILEYLTELAVPRSLDGTQVPGWFVPHDPDPLTPTSGGHLNLGMAHGAAGILAALSLAVRRGIVVPGQMEAIRYFRNFFDQWQQDAPAGPWWPQWLTRADLQTGVPTQPRPGRPSWCYGTIRPRTSARRDRRQRRPGAGSIGGIAGRLPVLRATRAHHRAGIVPWRRRPLCHCPACQARRADSHHRAAAARRRCSSHRLCQCR